MTQFYQLSGAERLGVELAQELNKRKIHTDILSMYTEDMPGVLEAKKELLQRGIPQVHFLRMKVRPSIASIIPAILNLRRLIKEEKYDIVETSMVSPTVLAAWAVRGTQSWHLAGLHQVFRRDRENSIRHWLWRFSIRCNPHIRYYSISDYASKAWVYYSRTPPQYTRTIYNAIPDDCFKAVADRQGIRTELRIPQNSRIALYVGRLAKYKGCDTLVDTLGPILKKSNLHLLLVGEPDTNVPGCGEMIDGMKKQIKDNGWNDWIRFLGYRKDIPRLLASADIIVHPTHMEGFGLVLVEAMAAGLPVVASNAEAIPEVLKNTDSIMVPPDDPESLRKAVIQTINRSPLEATVAIEKGRKRAEDFRIGRRIDSMLKLFGDALAQRL